MQSFALVFPGQGSQYVGMGKELCTEFRVARDVFTEASDTLGFDLASLCFEGPRERLDQTIFTQTAVLTADIAAFRVFAGGDWTEAPHHGRPQPGRIRGACRRGGG